MNMTYLNKGPSGTERHFRNTVSQHFGMMSRELHDAVSAVDEYIITPTAENLRAVVSAITTWKNRQPFGFARRLESIWPTLHVELLNEAEKYPNEFIACLDRTTVPPSFKNAYKWVTQVNTAKGLEQFQSYACLDATTHKRCIRGDYSSKGPVRSREAAWHKAHYAACGMHSTLAMVAAKHDWNASRLAISYKQIKGPGGKGAIHSTFGYLAAHILTDGRPRGPRVELVSHRKATGPHLFVIVGRQGGLTNQHKIPQDWDGVVVDAWAAAMGHRCVYPNRQSYVFDGLTDELELVMQRPAV